MAESTLYRGTLMMYDVDSGAEINVAIQVALTGRTTVACTIRSLVCDGHAPVTRVLEGGETVEVVIDLLDRMQALSVPA